MPSEAIKKAQGGMFAKDKEFGNRLDQLFAENEPFLVYGARVDGKTIATAFGDQPVATLDVEKLIDGKPSGVRVEANTIAAAIVEKASNAEPSDFPCVCDIRHVPSAKYQRPALVLQWLKDWQQTDDGIPY